ncbi:MAG: hypothetical protein CO141_03835 [Candidatus Moranbacteria bacterium CG_4_9_14_3_um_filter_42_9]|nr:MAG: hypothetical protein CO141_03835 [Candidatus Moranbacteria bacterium CG_4_9_14_3_um_filter_42_9]
MPLNLISINFFLFFFYFLFLIFPPATDNSFILRILFSLISLLVSLVLFGINFGLIIQWLIKKKYELWEFLSIASLGSLIFSPLLLTSEFTVFKILFPNLPIVNSFFIFILILFIFTLKKNSRDFLSINIPKLNAAEIIKSNFTLFFFFYFAVIFFLVTAYYPLPDLDPYYWHADITKSFSKNTITEIGSYRPLFSSLAYIFNQTSRVDLYAYFKYVIPFLSLLILIPANLFSKNFFSPLKKTLIFLFPIINASVFLYLETPIPQAILTIILFYFLFFLAHCSLSGKKEFFYFGGLSIFISYFYHEAAFLVFIGWLASFLIFDAKEIFAKFKKNKLALFLLIITLATNTSLIKNQLAFLVGFSKSTYHRLLSPILNLKFPASYVNVDGNAMGWVGISGIAKYYAYYVGFSFFIIFFLFIIKLIKNSEFRIFVKSNLLKNKSIFALVFCFSLFFLIAEIIPRFPGIAFLPERAWNFGGIFSTVFIIFIFVFLKDNKKILYYALILSFFINLSGAIYVNSQKKYLISNEQLSSAQWITDNLPKDRILFSSNKNVNLLKTFSHSKVIPTSDNFYFKSNDFGKKFDTKILSESFVQDYQMEYKNIIEEITQQIDKLSNKNIYSDNKEVIAYADDISKDLTKIKYLKIPNEEFLNKQFKYYVYYSNEDSRNPYLNRPYYKKNEIVNTEFIFDRYPDKFRRVYYNQKSNIIIWQIL